MKISIFDNYSLESFYQGMTEDSNGEPEPEEKFCAKCLELKSECRCHEFDELEIDELLETIKP